MSIRSGQRPRDQMAHPADPPNGATASTAAYSRAQTGRPRHHVRFLVFLAVTAGLVLVALVTVGRPILRSIIVPIAEHNRAALQLGLFDELVREDIGPALTQPAGTDPEEVQFEVAAGDTPESLIARLTDRGIVTSPRAFRYFVMIDHLGENLNAGTYLLRQNMTPEEVVRGLVENRITIQTVDINFREGLRLEQITAKLQTVEGTQIDAKEFYRLVTNPPKSLLDDYPWLDDPKIRTQGSTLEGFLYPATYKVRVDAQAPTSTEGLVRMMLDAFASNVGPDRMKVPKARGMTFEKVLTLASIIEREAAVDDERSTIAGVYQNRLNAKKWPLGRLQADPTALYANDTAELGAYSDTWQTYTFWTIKNVPEQFRNQLAALPLPNDIAAYNTYREKGLPPGPICTPTVESIDAALDPDTSSGYLFFVAIPDGGGTHDFSKTQAEHEAKLREYGYT